MTLALQRIGPGANPPFLDINVPAVVNAQGVLEITATVTDGAAAIPGPSLLTMSLTLYDKDKDSVINNRNGVDVKAMVDAQGALSLTLYPADNPVVTEGAPGTKERHVALIHYEWDSPVRGHWQEVLIDVVRLHRVGAE